MAISLAMLMVLGGFMLYPITMQNDDSVGVSADRTAAAYDDTEILGIRIQVYNTFTEEYRYIGWGGWWSSFDSEVKSMSSWASTAEVSTNDVITQIRVDALICKTIANTGALNAKDFARASLSITDPASTEVLDIGYSDWGVQFSSSISAYDDSHFVEFSQTGLDIPIDSVGTWTVDVTYQVYLA